MPDRLNTTTKNRQNSDSTFKVNPIQPRGFGVQAKSEESAPATKAQLWESYQQTKQLNQSGAIQAKLTIGQPGDKYEQEADSNAQQVMAMPASGLATSIVTNSVQTPSIEPIQRACTDCQEEPKEESKSEEDGDRIQAKEGLGQTSELTSVRRKLDSADDPLSGTNSDSQFDGSQGKSILAITDRPPAQIQRAPDKMPPPTGTTTINKQNENISASGNTLTEAITNLTSQGKGEAGRVTCAPEWNKQAWQADENKPAATIVTANVTVTETKAMPVWTELDRQCEPVKKEWARFYQALDKHEEGHIKIDETSFKDLHKKLLGKTPAIADEIYDTTVTQANTKNDAYDATTQHGLTQGTAVTPVQCQAMEKVSDNQDSDGEGAEVQAKFSGSLIQRAANNTLSVEPDLESRLGSSKGGGSPLSDDVRSFMEPRFGADFSGVRVHTGTDAVQMNQGVNAQAFAHGQDIYFGAGKSPGNNELTAHELTHVVQQTGFSTKALQHSLLVVQRDPLTPKPVTGTPKQQIIDALQKPNADYAEAFRILNGLAMFDILSILTALKRSGHFDILNSNLDKAVGIFLARLQLGFKALQAKGSVTAEVFTAEQKSVILTLPPDQRVDILNFLDAKWVDELKLDEYADIIIGEIRANPVFQSLQDPAKVLTNEIITEASKRKKNSFHSYIYCLEKLKLLFNTPTADSNKISAGTKASTDKEDKKEKARVSKHTAANKVGIEEQASKKYAKKMVPIKGKFGGGTYYVDRNSPTNIVVKANILLKAITSGDAKNIAASKATIKSIKRMEDGIEKAASAKGYLVDIQFVNTIDKDTFTVEVDPSDWETATNWSGGDPTGFAHELHHMFAFELDRYDYIESHAANDYMQIPDRLHWFREELNKPDDYNDATSLMNNAAHPNDNDICTVAGLDPTTCMAARKKLSK